MKTIAKIINIFGGVKNLHASIENPPYMRLVIEDIGIGPRRHQAISVTHYFTQNGDLCQHPELCFELVPQGGHLVYEPFSFQQAMPPVYQEVFENGPASENRRLKRQLMEFAQMWDRNLQQQGFVTAAAQQQARKNTYKTWNRMVGTVKKSIETILLIWFSRVPAYNP
jgi:hypothetical protein